MTFNEPIFYRKTSDESDDHTNLNDLRRFEPKRKVILIHSAVFRANMDTVGSNMDANSISLSRRYFSKSKI